MSDGDDSLCRWIYADMDTYGTDIVRIYDMIHSDGSDRMDGRMAVIDRMQILTVDDAPPIRQFCIQCDGYGFGCVRDGSVSCAVATVTYDQLRFAERCRRIVRARATVCARFQRLCALVVARRGAPVHAGRLRQTVTVSRAREISPTVTVCRRGICAQVDES